MDKEITRRLFLRGSLFATAAFCLGCEGRSAEAKTESWHREARFYEKRAEGRVNCRLCFRKCVIRQGGRGFCRNRENRDGILYSLVYGRPAALQLDPIEKEPMFHNLPGTTILCTGTASCNFRCKFCHNWHLSQRTFEELEPYSRKMSPEDIVDRVIKREAGLSFTYNEPTVFFEFMYDIARLGREKGLNTIFHTNGGMQAEPMKALLLQMKGVTVDLKGFTADYYKDVSFASMTPVLNTLKLIKQEGKWLEIVNLLVPTLNDDMKLIHEMCVWIRENLGPEVPVHFSRFFPAYKMKHLPPTPVKTLEKARKTAIAEGIKFVYIGNVPGHKYNSTFCPECGKKIISRIHFSVRSVKLKNGRCKYCNYPVPGIWDL
ncbi:MAG: AmmeMemoRadiSam system radical SAM enzyme [Desulforhopalus sp.]|nr:AmmeMemoRadiSam system radical SAM enzyme [Desulforhopalus sp.]